MTGHVAAPSARPPSEQDLGSRLRATLGEVISLLQRSGEEQRVALLEREAQRGDGTPIVVVAGEAKTGKSSLINALLGRPGLSPVDSDIATGSRIVFMHSKQDTAAVHLIGEQETHPIKLDQIAEWTSVEGNPGNEKGVESVMVALTSPLLASMTLVDTPGIGGLDEGHGRRTVQSLRHADALIFVSDAQSPFSGSELAFLGQATERIGTVVFVLAKADRADVDEVLARDAELLRKRAPRFASAPIIAVSSTGAERARRLADASLADQRLERSGLPALERLLSQRIAGRAALLRLVNTLRFAESSLRALEHRLQEQAGAAGGDPAVGRALESERQRLAELRRTGAEWTQKLEFEIADINWNRANEMTREIARIRARYDELSMQCDRPQLAALPGQLMDDVAALADRIASETSDGVKQLGVQILGQIAPDSALAETLNALAGATTGAEVELPAPVHTPPNELDRLTTLVSFSSGHSLGAFVMTLPVIGLVGAPLAIAGAAIGGVFAWKMGKGRRLQALQAQFRAWQAQQLVLVDRLLTNEFNRRMAQVKADLRQSVSDYLKRREAELTQSIEQNRRAQESDAETRQHELARIEAGLRPVRHLLLQTDALLAELGNLGD